MRSVYFGVALFIILLVHLMCHVEARAQCAGGVCHAPPVAPAYVMPQMLYRADEPVYLAPVPVYVAPRPVTRVRSYYYLSPPPPHAVYVRRGLRGVWR